MMSLQKKSPIFLHKNKAENEIVDLTTRMNELRLSALSKACAINSATINTTIGPNSLSDLNNTDINGPLDKSSVVTSTPQPAKSSMDNVKKSLKGRVKNPFFNTSGVNDSKSCDEIFAAAEGLARKKLLDDFENKRKFDVYEKVLDHFLIMKEEERKIQQILEESKESLDQERLARTAEEFAEVTKLLEEEEVKAKLNLQKVSQNRIIHAKRLNETNELIKQLEQQQRELEEKAKQIKRENRQRLDKIYEKQIEYSKIYQQIHDVSKLCKDSKEFLKQVVPEAQKLKLLNESFERILEKCEKNTATNVELKGIQHLVEQLHNIYLHFVDTAERINKALQKEQEQKDEERAKEAKRLEQKEKEKVKMKEIADAYIAELSDCVDSSSFQKHVQLSEFLEKYEKSLAPLLSDDKTKKFRFDCQKAVNVPVNAISHTNSLHMEDKFTRLSQLLSGQSVAVGNDELKASSHPLGISYCTNLLAKKFVKQGEHVVSSKPEVAFAIAAVIVALWVEFPDFGHLLMANFQKECPYLIPAYMPQVEGQSNEDYYKLLGYYYTDGQVESQDKFLKRMSGIMRLYAAILITQLKRNHVNKQHPLGINEAWRWLAATLNLEPRPDISATLIYDLIEVTGNVFYQTYGAQFQKILIFLCTEYFTRIEKVTPDGCGGPVSRLKGFLEKILVKRFIPPPVGQLPANFW